MGFNGKDIPRGVDRPGSSSPRPLAASRAPQNIPKIPVSAPSKSCPRGVPPLQIRQLAPLHELARSGRPIHSFTWPLVLGQGGEGGSPISPVCHIRVSTSKRNSSALPASCPVLRVGPHSSQSAPQPPCNYHAAPAIIPPHHDMWGCPLCSSSRLRHLHLFTPKRRVQILVHAAAIGPG